MAARIDHTEARIPAPTADLVGQMAKAVLVALIERGLIEPCEWNGLDEYTRDALMEVAKRCYGTVAMFGGAKLKPIKDM